MANAVSLKCSHNLAAARFCASRRRRTLFDLYGHIPDWPASPLKDYPISRRPSVRRVTSEDISDEVLLAETKRLKIEASPVQLKQKMPSVRALRIFVYRARRARRRPLGGLYSKFAKSHAISLRIP